MKPFKNKQNKTTLKKQKKTFPKIECLIGSICPLPPSCLFFYLSLSLPPSLSLSLSLTLSLSIFTVL